MAEPDLSRTPPPGGVFSTRPLNEADLKRAVTRIAHEIVEHNKGLDGVVLVGVQKGGVWLAQRLAARLAEIEPGTTVPLGTVDISMYRDDIGLRPIVPGSVTDLPDLNGATVVLVDDVLFTGRTIRAALDAIGDHGRPRAVQLAVMVDRGHRELPIRPDYVGKNLPTSRSENVSVTADGVVIERPAAAEGAPT